METMPDFTEVEKVLEEILGNPVDFGNVVFEMSKTGQTGGIRDCFNRILKIFLEQLKNGGEVIGYLFLLILSAAVLTVISKAFKNKQISQMGFYMIYLIMFLILLKSFSFCYTLTEGVITDLISFMQVLMPAYFIAVAGAAYKTSAVVYYEAFFLMIYYVQKIVLLILLPSIRGYVMFTLLSVLGEEDLFSGGRKLLKKWILWAFHAMLLVTTGMQLVQSVLTPAVDRVKHTAFSSGLSGLGSVGNVTKNITDVMLGSALLLKNAIGVAAAVLIVGICLVPVIQVSAHTVFYQLLAAFSEPVSERRVVDLIGNTAEGMGMLVKLLFTVGGIFLITIALICVSTGGMG